MPRAPGGHITALNVTYKRTSASGAPKVSLFKYARLPHGLAAQSSHARALAQVDVHAGQQG